MVQEVAGSSLNRARVSPSDDWKTLFVNQAVNGYPFFKSGKEKGSKSRRVCFTFHQLCPRYNGSLIPTASTAIRLWETFTFTERVIRSYHSSIHRIIRGFKIYSGAKESIHFLNVGILLIFHRSSLKFCMHYLYSRKSNVLLIETLD